MDEKKTRNWATPPVDILEDGEKILLRTDLPGVKKNDIQLTLEDGALQLRAVRLSRDLTYRRTFTLSREIDPTSVEAQLRGVSWS